MEIKHLRKYESKIYGRKRDAYQKIMVKKKLLVKYLWLYKSKILDQQRSVSQRFMEIEIEDLLSTKR